LTASHRLELRRLLVRAVEELLEQLVGQEIDVFGEETEHALHQEVRHVERRMSLLLEGDRELADLGGDVARDLLDRELRLERLGVGEDAAELVEGGGLGELVQRDRVDLLGRAGEVGVNFRPGDVADDQQRGIAEGFAIDEQLSVGVVEVFVFALALVLPGELVLPPRIGEPAIALGAE
jgi:hypothetical protein